jgi:CBS domain-containing protein
MTELKVNEVMTGKVIHVSAPGKKADALRLLIENKISGLPVVKKDTMKLVGIVTRRNIFDHPHEQQVAMLMTKDPVSVKPDTSLRGAVSIMLEKGLRRLPVVQGEKLVGILTMMDILRIVEKERFETPIEGHLGGPCVPVYEGTPLKVAATIFDVTKAYALPVLDACGCVVGIVTDYDIFSCTSLDTKTVMSSMGLGNDEDAWNPEGIRNLMRLYYEISEKELPNIPVKKVMVKDPETVTKKTSVSEAAMKMRSQNFRQLPVVDDNDRLVAMLFDVDLMSVLLK